MKTILKKAEDFENYEYGQLFRTGLFGKVAVYSLKRKDGNATKYDFLVNGGSATFTEGDDISQWNFEPINENEPDYDKNISQSGEIFGQFFDIGDIDPNDGDATSKKMMDNMMNVFKKLKI